MVDDKCRMTCVAIPGPAEKCEPGPASGSQAWQPTAEIEDPRITRQFVGILVRHLQARGMNNALRDAKHNPADHLTALKVVVRRCRLAQLKDAIDDDSQPALGQGRGTPRSSRILHPPFPVVTPALMAGLGRQLASQRIDSAHTTSDIRGPSARPAHRLIRGHGELQGI